MPYRWEPTVGVSGRYRDERGRFVASSTVRRELDRYLDTADPAKALAEALRGRQLSLADWEVGMRRVVKNTHLNAIALERGGWANMTPADYGRAGQIIREQYGYLKGFAADIASGKQRLDGTLGVRAKLYTQAGRESFYRSKQANLQPGIDMVRSIKHARDSCRDCEYLNGKWFKVGDPAYSLPGRRQCNKNCRCTEEYGRQTADGVEAVEGEGVSAGGDKVVHRPPGFNLPEFIDDEGVRYYQPGRLPEGIFNSEWVNKLTPEEKAAIEHWTSGGFRGIRESWANNNEAQDRYSRAIESALAKAPRVSGTVYRGLSAPDSGFGFNRGVPRVVEQYQRAVGTTMEWNQPASASLGSETARGWGQVLFEIDVKDQPLIRAASKHDYEDEVLIWGRTRYTVKEVIKAPVYRYETDQLLDTWIIKLTQK